MSALLELFDGITERWLEVMWPAVWQSAILAGVVFLVTWRLKRGPAALRFWLWMLVPLKLLVMPLATIGVPLLPEEGVDEAPAAVETIEFVQADYAAEPIDARERIAPERAKVAPERTVVSVPAEEDWGKDEGVATAVVDPGERAEVSAAGVRASWRVWVMGVWIVGVVFFGVKLLRGWARMRRVVARGREVASEEAMGAAEEAARMMGLGRMPRVLVTDEAVSPFVSGVVRATAVLPAALVKEVSREELTAVLAHEFAHLKRRDPAFGWLLAVCEAIYFFHPVMHLAKRRILFERERACDERVLASEKADRRVYASAMVTAAEVHRELGARTSAVPVVAESFGDLKRRLTMMASDLRRVARLSRRAIVLVAILSVIAVPGFVLTARSAERGNEEAAIAEQRESEEGTEVQLGPTAGEWETLYAFQYDGGPNGKAIKGPAGWIAVKRLERQKQGVGISVAHTVAGQKRVVAVDQSGHVHGGGQGHTLGEWGFQQIDVCFPHLEWPDVKEFRFEARGYKPVESRDMSPRPQERTEGPAEKRMRHFVMLVVGKEKMTFEGEETTWEELAGLLEKVPDRGHTVLTVAIESDEMTLRQVNEARSRGGLLSQQFGFEYLSFVGVHPLGSKGDKSQEIGEGREQGREAVSVGDFLVNIRFDPTGREQKYLFTEIVLLMRAESGGAEVFSQEMNELGDVFRDRILSVLRTKEFLEIQNPENETKLKHELKTVLNEMYEERKGRKGAVEQVLFTKWEIR